MRILDRYITKSVILTFLGTTLIFCLLYVLIDWASNLDEFLDRKVSLTILLRYYLNYLPIIIAQTSPIACLISTLLVYSNLNSHNEVIALRSSGMNFWQITKPVIGFVCVISALVFLINERYVPLAEETAKQIRTENMILEVDRKRKNKAAIKNLTFYGLKNRLYFIDTFDPNTFELQGLTIVGYDNNQNIKEKIVALSGKWTSIAWKVSQCHITSYDDSIVNAPTKVRVYQEKLLDIKETPEDFLKQRLNIGSMNIRQLYDYIDRFSNSGAKRALNNLRVDLHQKIAFPFGTLIIVLVGLPLALLTRSRKGQTFTSLGIAVGIGFLYYVSNAVGLALGKGGFFPPLLAAWITPLFFCLAGFVLIKTKF